MLLDNNNLLEIIKTAAVDAVNAEQDCDYCFGTVISASPLKIQIEQKMILTSAQLVLTRNVTNFTTTVNVNWGTGYTSSKYQNQYGSFASHNHSVSGDKSIKIYNGLRNGEKVVLMRKKGGQTYLVLDRVVKA